MNSKETAKNAWRYYEYGRGYNNSLSPNQYNVVNTNQEFFTGNQWINLPDNPAMRKLAKPVFNIIKRVTTLFIASLTSSNTTINFEPLSYQDDNDAASFATAEVRNLFEKFKIDYRIRDALFDGAITGDYCAHFFWNADATPYGGAFSKYRGEIEMELLDGINVMFGNPNCRDVEKQPYILLVGRDTVESLRNEAMERGAENPEYITPDSEVSDIAGIGGRVEISGHDEKTGKALFVYLYTKVSRDEPFTDPLTGTVRTRKVTTVHVTKATRRCVIFEDIDTGLARYPIAWGNWQKQRNQYHGRALVTEIIPNQIFINQMMAMVFRHLQTQAFPTKLYNADVLPNISNEVGAAIGVRNLLPGQNLGDIVTTLPASNMSDQIIQAIDLCMAYTKECLGATDAQLGTAKADNTSALMVVQHASEVPLENIRSGLHEWVEDIGAILLDMMGTYYGKRPVQHEKMVETPVLGADGQQLVDPLTGKLASLKKYETVFEEYDFSTFKNLWFNISADVGATTYYSEIAMVQTLDNLRHDGMIDVIEYLERIPDKLIARKQELIDKLRKELADQKLGSIRNGGGSTSVQSDAPGYAMGGELDAAKKLAGLPTSLQASFSELPKKAQAALLKH